MASHFALSFLFLDAAFHGRREGGEPEWPPSPLRAFQALVAAAAARGRTRSLGAQDIRALEWLEKQSPPIVVAPVGLHGSRYATSVPLNAMDVVGKAWVRGQVDSDDANPATHRTMKTVCATWLRGGGAVHYLWPLSAALDDESRNAGQTLAVIARSVVVLGWGIDHVVANGAVLSPQAVESITGERWLPVSGDGGLRVPIAGTLAALLERHQKFLGRLSGDALTPPPPLTRFANRAYRRATDPATRPAAAFSVMKSDGSGFRPFDTAHRALTVAGMVRHATKRAATQAGWSTSRIDAFVLGHGSSRDDTRQAPVGPRRFAYLPLPSIEARGESAAGVLTNVRRVLVTSFADDCESEIAWAQRALSGQELVEEDHKQSLALLSPLPPSDSVVRRYTEPAICWVTATPVILPGFDDPAGYRRRLAHGLTVDDQIRLLARLDARVDTLLRKAIVHAGFSRPLADYARLDWRSVGFLPGAARADRYGVPDHLRLYPRFHVRIRWRGQDGGAVEVPGPICLGGGRFYGLGLFVSEP